MIKGLSGEEQGSPSVFRI